MTDAGAVAQATVWDKIRANYTQWVLFIGIGVFLPFSYFVASATTPLIVLIGVFLLGHLKSLKVFWPVAALTAMMLVLGFIRSDFVDMLAHGESLKQASHDSKMYFRAPMLMWAAIWAVVCAGYNLSEAQSRRVFKWFGLVMLVLTGLLAAEAASHFGLRDAINRAWFKGARPEMVVVRVSDSNFVLLFLFWPLTFYFMARRWIAAVVAMALVVSVLAVVVDTNAQLLGLILSGIVFAIAKYWPRNLSGRGVTPERVMAVLVGIFILAFPFIMLWLARSGLALKIKPHLGASWAARIDIWSFAVNKAAEKPWFGWGYEASRLFVPIIPNHPHSPALQAWLELGVPGLVILAALWFAIFWCMAPKGEVAAPETDTLAELTAIDTVREVDEGSVAQQARPYLLALAVTYFFINAISFGIWRDWLYTLGAFAVAMSLISIKAVNEGKRFQF